MYSPIALAAATVAFQRGYEAGFRSFHVESSNPYPEGSFSRTDYDAGFAYGVDDSFQAQADDAYAAEVYAEIDAIHYGTR